MNRRERRRRRVRAHGLQGGADDGSWAGEARTGIAMPGWEARGSPGCELEAIEGEMNTEWELGFVAIVVV